MVDGDPQTALVRSESFFLSRALNPAGDQDTSLYLPTVIVADGLAAAALESYHVVVLCNVGSLTDTVAQKLRNYLAQGGGLLMFGGDRLELDNYNQKLAQALPAQLREKKVALETSAEKIGKIALDHPALNGFTDAILHESLTSSRVWGYFRGDGAGKSVLVALGNGDPLMLEQKVGAGRVIFIATSADRDWTDLPLKTAYLPLIQSLTNYLAGGKRGALDDGVAVGSTKEIPLPASLVGKSVRVTHPDKQQSETDIVAEKDRSIVRLRRK